MSPVSLRISARLAICAALAALLFPSQGRAGGYEVRQQGSGIAGTSAAGASAGAHGLEDVAFNPAVVGLVEAPEARTALTLIAPDSRITEARGTTGMGTPAGGASGVADVMPDKLVPALYLAAPLDGRVTLGLSLSAPFGLETNHPDGWAGRYHALDTEVTTLSVGPVASVELSDDLLLGAGVQAQYYRGRLSNAVDFATVAAGLGQPAPVPSPASDGRAEVDADDWALAFRLGLVYTPAEGTRIGIGYRSEVRHDLSGDVDFTSDGLGIGRALAAQGVFRDGGARARITTPRSLSLGVSQDLGERVTLLGEAQWTDWSAFDRLTVQFDNPAQPADRTRHDWDDGWFVALGLRWQVAPAWTVSGGVSYDRSPVPDGTRTPRIPDADRTWLSIGARWSPEPWISVDAGYGHLFMPESPIAVGAAGDPRGRLEARTGTEVDVLSLSARIRF